MAITETHLLIGDAYNIMGELEDNQSLWYGNREVTEIRRGYDSDNRRVYWLIFGKKVLKQALDVGTELTLVTDEPDIDPVDRAKSEVHFAEDIFRDGEDGGEEEASGDHMPGWIRKLLS